MKARKETPMADWLINWGPFLQWMNEQTRKEMK